MKSMFEMQFCRDHWRAGSIGHLPVARLAFLLAFVFGLAATDIAAQNVPADSVTANGTPGRWGHSSCQATLAELSDGSISNPGACYLAPLDPNFTITFAFSPAPADFMTGIRIWSNAGNSMNDNELRQLDVEVDYFDPTTNSTQTLSLDNVNIGNTTSFDDPKLISFGGATGLYQVSAVRINDMVGTSATGRVVFREVQGVFATQAIAPEIVISSSETGGVSDGGTDAQGTEPAGVAKTVTYTITNSGTDTLTLAGTPTVSNETNLAGGVTVGAPGSLSLAPGASTTFEVSYTPDAAGPFGFDIDVPSNDADEATFDIAVSGTANEAPSVVLTSDPSAPPGGPFTVTATFSEDVTGMTLADFDVGNGTATGLSNPSPGVYVVSVTPTDALSPVDVQVPANAATDGDGAPNSASNSLSLFVIGAPTPPELAEIEQIIIDETVRDLRNAILLNQRAGRAARDRLVGYLRCAELDEDQRQTDQVERLDACPELRELTVEPVFDGKFSATEKSIAGSGTFFAQKSNYDGTKRRLASGELSFNRYEDGDTSANLDGRVAWERMVGEDTMRGLFVGASATLSDIDDTFEGSRTGFGLNAGAYFVDRLDDNLFWDGFISLGVGRNNLDLSNGTLDVDGDYNTRSVQVGLAVSGEHVFDGFELHPEFSLAYGITSVGDTDIVSTSGVTTTADTISGDTVALGIIRFRPEFLFGGERDQFGAAKDIFSVAPSVLCETVRANTADSQCGGGLELEWSSVHKDGYGEFSARASREIVGGDARDQLSLTYERQF